MGTQDWVMIPNTIHQQASQDIQQQGRRALGWISTIHYTRHGCPALLRPRRFQQFDHGCIPALSRMGQWRYPLPIS